MLTTIASLFALVTMLMSGVYGYVYFQKKTRRHPAFSPHESGLYLVDHHLRYGITSDDTLLKKPSTSSRCPVLLSILVKNAPPTNEDVRYHLIRHGMVDEWIFKKRQIVFRFCRLLDIVFLRFNRNDRIALTVQY